MDIINKTFKTSIDTRVTDLILRYEEPTTISEDPVAAFQVFEFVTCKLNVIYRGTKTVYFMPSANENPDILFK